MMEFVKCFCGLIVGFGNEFFYYEDCLYVRENIKYCNVYCSDVYVRFLCI